MLKVAVFMLFAFTFSTTSAFSWLNIWGGGGGRPQPRHCRWGAYYTVTECDKVGKYTYAYKQERQQIPARDGGRPCTGRNYRFLPCTELEYVALYFKRTVGTASSDVTASSGGQSGGSFRRAHDPLSGAKCANDHVDRNGTKRMAGLRCSTTNSNLRAGPRNLASPILSTKHRDITLLIDESGSVGPDKFKKFVKLGQALVNSFCGAISISKQQTRVGIMSFDLKQHYHLNFDKFFDKVQIINHMGKIPYNSGTHGRTCLVDALKQTREEMITEKRGARVKHPQTTERVVIMMTDGCANCNPRQGDLIKNLQELRKKFEQQKIPFITFFVGDNNRCVEIMQEGLANGALCYQVFRAMNWGELDQMTTAIETSPCMDAWSIGPSCPT